MFILNIIYIYIYIYIYNIYIYIYKYSFPSKHTSIGPMLALYWRVPFVPATVQTVLSQYTGHTMIKVDVLACIGPALARFYWPSIGPLVSAQHWPDTSQFQHCSARCRRGSFSWRHLGNAILPPNWEVWVRRADAIFVKDLKVGFVQVSCND